MAENDCQGEDPVMMLVERLRAIDKEIPWHARDEAAEALLSLSQERDRLREIADLTHTILNGCEWWIIETPNEGALAKAFALLGRPITAKETRRDIDRDYADFRAALNKEPPCET